MQTISAVAGFPGDGGDDLLQLGQTGARAAAGWRHGET